MTQPCLFCPNDRALDCLRRILKANADWWSTYERNKPTAEISIEHKAAYEEARELLASIDGRGAG